MSTIRTQRGARALLAFLICILPTLAVAKSPNILVIWGDDIGITNLSAYSDGLMGYTTPNIDRIARDGIRFTYQNRSHQGRHARR